MPHGSGRWTASSRYGMVGFGAAGPAVPLNVINGGNNAASAELPPESPTHPADVTAFSGRLMDDPTFWMVASIGAVLFLAAYSAGDLGGG